jgi:hypothetical protein
VLNPFKLLAIYSDLNKLEGVAKEKATMQVKIPQLVALLVSLSATIGLPTLVANWVHAHAVVYLAIVAVAVVLHALMPSIFAAPSAGDTQATGLNKVGIVLLMIGLGAMCAPRVNAQTRATSTTTATASASNGFSGASTAVAIYYAGGWSAGTHVTESYDFVDFGKTKSNHLYVEGHELLAPTPGLNIYAGGLKYEPDLSALLKKTNLPMGNFGVTFSAALGNGVPASGGSHISFLAGGGVKYQLTKALTWQTLETEYGQYGSNRFAVISTGLSFLFGGK